MLLCPSTLTEVLILICSSSSSSFFSSSCLFLLQTLAEHHRKSALFRMERRDGFFLLSLMWILAGTGSWLLDI